MPVCSVWFFFNMGGFVTRFSIYIKFDTPLDGLRVYCKLSKSSSSSNNRITNSSVLWETFETLSLDLFWPENKKHLVINLSVFFATYAFLIVWLPLTHWKNEKQNLSGTHKKKESAKKIQRAHRWEKSSHLIY